MGRMNERYVVEPSCVAEAEKAGRKAARYAHINPLDWIERSALAGVKFGLIDQGGFFSCFLDADFEEASFLDAWLHASSGAAEAVERILRQRNIAIF